MVHYQPVALQHSQPLSPPVLCKCQKQNLCPKQRRAGSYCGPRSLAPTCPPPDSSMEIRFRSSVCCETGVSPFFFFFFLSKPTQQLCPDVLSPRAEKAAKNVNRACENMVMVCVVSCFQVFHLCLLHGGSPPSESLSPSPTLAPPPAPSPSAGFRHSLPVDTLVTVGHIQKVVFLMVVLIQLAHGCTSGRYGVVDKEE